MTKVSGAGMTLVTVFMTNSLFTGAGSREMIKIGDLHRETDYGFNPVLGPRCRSMCTYGRR